MSSNGTAHSCSLINEATPIEVSADIAGIGIVLGFVILAAAVPLMTFLAYFKELLPGALMSWADLGLLQNCHPCRQCRRRFQIVTTTITQTTHTKMTCKHTRVDLDIQRRDTFRAIMMTLGDQLLAVGPAMVTAALVQRKSISCFELNLVHGYALLASCSHLISLVTLMDVLSSNNVLRTIRVLGMLLCLALVIYTVLLSNACYAVDASANLQCVMDDFSKHLANSERIGWAVTDIVMLCLIYYINIASLYSLTLDEIILRQYYCRMRHPGLSKGEFQQWYYEMENKRYTLLSDANRDFLWNRTSAESGHRFVWLSTFFVVLCEYLYGFASQIHGFLWLFTFSSTNFIYVRRHTPEVTNSLSDWEFGQVVPVFLLILPILSGVEAFFLNDRYINTQPDAVRAFQVDNAGGLRKRDDDLSILLKVMENNALSNPSSGAASVGQFVKESATRLIVTTSANGKDLVSHYGRKDVKDILNMLFWTMNILGFLAGIATDGRASAAFAIISYTYAGISLSAFAFQVLASAYSMYRSIKFTNPILDRTSKMSEEQRAQHLEKAFNIVAETRKDGGGDAGDSDAETIAESVQATAVGDVASAIRVPGMLSVRTTFARDEDEIDVGVHRVDTESGNKYPTFGRFGVRRTL